MGIALILHGLLLLLVALIVLISSARKDALDKTKLSRARCSTGWMLVGTLFFLSGGYGSGISELGVDGRNNKHLVILSEDAIYETLSSVQVSDTEWAVVLKAQDGDLFAFILQENPPKIFKRGWKAGKPTYDPYPPPPVDTNVKSEVPDPHPEGK